MNKKVGFQIWGVHPAEIRNFRKTANNSRREVGKFQKLVEMKVYYPSNKKNTLKNYSKRFRKIENFVQVDHLVKVMKNSSIFPIFCSRKTADDRKIFHVAKKNTYKCQIRNGRGVVPDYRVQISVNLDRNLYGGSLFIF
jgi:hypothetical protein